MDLQFLRDSAPVLLQGLRATLGLTLFGACGALSLGLLIGLGRTSSHKWLSLPCLVWVESLRNVPVIIHMFILYFAVGLDAFLSGSLALALYGSAYMAEIFRAALLAVPKGMLEAGFALSISRADTLRYIKLPLAISYAVPALITEIINVLKNSAVAMSISVTELSFSAKELESSTFRGFEAATIVTIIYLVIAGTISLTVTAVERRRAAFAATVDER